MSMELRQAIEDIIRVNEHICDFWGDGGWGWAPSGSAELLSKSRLDWQVSLSKNLLRWFPLPSGDKHDGSLILAWVNLGVLVEGTMMWFLCNTIFQLLVFYACFSCCNVRKSFYING